MAYSYIASLLGYMAIILGISMGIPAAIEFVEGGPDVLVFTYTSVGVLFVASLVVLSQRHEKMQLLSIRDAFLLTSAVWFVSIIIGCIPLRFGSLDLSWTDALFQSTSMLTTTGANLILNLDYTSHGILFWCSLMQWLGGKGIILMTLLFLPSLRVGGMQLFHTESSDKSEKIVPRMTHMAFIIFAIYVALTSLCSLLLWFAGFTGFDAICHGMTTISTGGFSTWDNSMKHPHSLLVECLVSVFMILGACPFILYASAYQNGIKKFFKDYQVRGLLLTIFFFSLMLSVWRYTNVDINFVECFVGSLFNITSAITTTGYVSSDYGQWGGLALIVFFILPFVGGCSGSTSGGIKIVRVQILWFAMLSQLKKLRHPHGVFAIKYNGQTVSDGVLLSVCSFCALFLLTFAIMSIGVGLSNLDFITSISASISVLTTLGPGLGDVIGPSGNYESLSDGVKWWLSLGMIMGRVELVSIVLLLLPSFWEG